MRPILCALILSACATPGYRAAACERFPMKGYNIAVCADESVGEHCKRECAMTDSGKPVTYHPRACHIPGKAGRKSTIFVGRSFTACVIHEICHEEHPGNPLLCEKKYPCVGDR